MLEERNYIYAEITARIIDQMENGIIPWQKPWVANGKAISHATGKCSWVALVSI